MSPSDPDSGPASGTRDFVALRVVQYGMLFAAAVVVTRALGPVGRAQYAVPLVLASSVQIVTHLTLEGAAARLYGRREIPIEALCRVLAAGTVVLTLVGVAGTLAIGLPARHGLLSGASATTVVLAACTLPGIYATQMAGHVLLFLGDLRRYAVVRAVAAAAQLAGAVALVSLTNLTPSMAAGLAFGGWLATGAPLAILLARRVGWKALVPWPGRAAAKRVLRVGVALHPASVAFQLGFYIDLLVVSAMTASADTGRYSLATTLADAAFLAAQGLVITALPRQIATPSEATALAETRAVMRRVMKVSALTVAGAGIASYPFVMVVYGSSWRAAVLPLVILLVAHAAMTLEAVPRQLLTRIGRPTALAALAAGGLVANVLLTVLLIPPFGIVGAAVASCISFWLYASAMVKLLARTVRDGDLIPEAA